MFTFYVFRFLIFYPHISIVPSCVSVLQLTLFIRVDTAVR